jgi:GAF domain-containing protein
MRDKLVDVIENEARLEALRRTSLLDSPPEEAFDRLTRLATTLLRVPVSIVSLVDDNRVFLKSQCGVSAPLASSRQVALTHSYCRYALASREPLVVPDARREPNLEHSPALTDLGMIAFAGIPLITSEGHALGTFCVLNGRPHDWTEEEIEALRVPTPRWPRSSCGAWRTTSDP